MAPIQLSSFLNPFLIGSKGSDHGPNEVKGSFAICLHGSRIYPKGHSSIGYYIYDMVALFSLFFQ